MKKTYIEPKNTVVFIKMETMIAQSTTDVPQGDAYDPSAGLEIQSREVINTPDAWGEW